MTINWGAWAESGMAAAAGLDRMKRLGFGAIKPEHGVGALGYLILGQVQNSLQISSIVGSIFYWDCMNRSEHMFKELIPSAHDASKTKAQSEEAASQSSSANNGGSKLMEAAAIAEEISLSVRHIIGSSVGLHDPLVAAGLDSLGAVELRNDLSKQLGCSLPGTLVFDYPSIDAISNFVIPQLLVHAEEDTPQTHIGSAELASYQPKQHVGIVGINKRAPRVSSSGASMDAIQVAPLDRWDVDQTGSRVFAAGRFGGFLQNWGAYFDIEAFAVSSPEAMFMDPQQRVLLEDAAEFVFLSSNTAVAVGIAKLGEPAYYPSTTGKSGGGAGGGYVATGKALSVAAGRLSYTFGFSGPCVAIDAACSSSLVGLGYVHSAMATTSCTSGLACGINLPMNWETSSMFMAAGMMAYDGRCKTLDASANGYVRSEASVVVALQIEALSPLAIVAGVATNQDGRSSTLTAPNGPSQQAVIAQAAELSKLSISSISGIEMHGTGTALGDPIEIGALCSVLLRGSNSRSRIALGTTKSRSGHAETAAGLLGLTNAVAQLQLSNQQPTMHLRTLNIYVENALAESKLSFVPARQEAAYSSEGAIGISAFAFQGTNAHALVKPGVVVEDQWQQSSKVVLVHKQRLWHIPAPHAFLSTVLSAARTSVQFEVDYHCDKSTYLWQHCVNGRSVLPGAALLDTLQAAASTLCNGNSVCLAAISIPSAHLLVVRESSKTVCVVEEASVRVFSRNNGKLMPHCNATIENRGSKVEERKKTCTVSRVLFMATANTLIHTASTGCVDNSTQIPASMDASLHLAATFTDGGRNIPYVPSKLSAFSLDRQAAATAAPFLWVSQAGIMDEKHMLASTRGSSNSWVFNELESKPLGAASKIKAEVSADLLYATTYLVEVPVEADSMVSSHFEFQLQVEDLGSTAAIIEESAELDSFSAALAILQTRSIKSCSITLPRLNSGLLTIGLHAMLKVGDAELADGIISGCFGGRNRNWNTAAAQNMPLLENACLKTPLLTKMAPDNGRFSALPTFNTRTAIITGGMGALGQLVAAWLQAGRNEAGRLKVILLGRTASQWQQSTRSLDDQSRIEVHAVQCDVSQREDFNFENLGMAATSIYHASGSVKDASISNQNPALLRFSLAPKLESARSIATSMVNSAPIESWVNFSSVASMLGNGGQASYAAANGALDGFTTMMNTSGISCTSLQWGPWAGSGMASVQQGVARRLERLGMVLITPAVGLEALQRACILSTQPILGAVHVFDWNKLLRSSQKELGIYSELLPEKQQRVVRQRPALQNNARQIMNASVRLIAEEAIGVSIPDDNSTFMAIGLDSMGAIELRNALIQKFNVDLPATVTFDYPSVSKLASFISSSTLPDFEEIIVLPKKQSQRSVEFASTVQSIVSNVLGKYVPAEEFMQAGMDSMGAIELRAALESEFSVSLPATITYDYPTSSAMGKYLEESFGASGGGGDGGSVYQSVSASAAKQPSSAADSTTGFISMASMYPHNGAVAPVAQLLSNTDVQHVVPSSRWDVDAHYNPVAEDGKMYVRFGGWLDNIDVFNSALLRLSPTESVGMDPQTRLLLEKAFEASSDVSNGVSNQTGVYVGCMYTEYLDGILGPAGLANSSASSITGHGLSFMVGRLSFTFGWQGPCISTDTACSSSLVALHLAHQGIMRHESEFALAGGVNVMLIPQTTSRICLLQALSSVGRCKALDASSDGYGRGEALCIGLLASSTHPDISALIKGSAVQQNGTSSGLTAPNGPSQSALIRQALQVQTTVATDLKAVSLHGTGTPLGDPIEVGALIAVLGSKHRTFPLTIGASKTCFGHTEGTAGMTGILLALTYLQQQVSAPIVNLRALNPYVQPSLLNNAAHVPRQAAPTIVQNLQSCVAGTSSFGMSGVNAHAIFSIATIDNTRNASVSEQLPLCMERSRCWPLPTLHPFVAGVVVGAAKIMEFSVRSQAFLHDHQVFGRDIMPASGMFEILHAVACTGMEQVDAGAISGATIQSALPLDTGLDGSLMKATLQFEGSISLTGSHAVVYIGATYRKLAQHSISPSSSCRSPLSQALFNTESPMESQGNNFASLSACSTPHLQFFSNPASLDSCIHLAPVPRAGEPLQETKVPTAVGGFLITGKASGVRSWAIARTISQTEGLSAISWVSGSSQHQLVDLVARPMARGSGNGGNGGSGSSKEIGVSAEYEIEWQVSENVLNTTVKFGESVVVVVNEEQRVQVADVSSSSSRNCSELGAKLLSIAHQVSFFIMVI
jgi:acyl transferase domain-containing protein/acyl carrier protein